MNLAQEAISNLIAAISLVVTVVATVFGYLAVYPRRRRLVHGVAAQYGLLGSRASGEVEVRVAGRPLADPHVVEFAVRLVGRSGIETDDFVAGAPLEVDFGPNEVRADLSEPENTLPHVLEPAAGPGRPTRVVVRPTRIRTGRTYQFTLLFDGEPADRDITFRENLRNVTPVARDDEHRQRHRKRTLFAYATALLLAGVGVGAGFGAFGAPNALVSVVLLVSAFAPLSLGLLLSNRRNQAPR